MVMLASVLVAATFTRTLERVASMDPAMARSIYDSHAIQLVYEPPLEVDYEARPYKLIPCFCELPEVSEDGLVYRFEVKVNTGNPTTIVYLHLMSSPLPTWCGRWSGFAIRRWSLRTGGS